MNENVSEEGFVISKFLFKKVLDNLSEFSDYINDQESFKLYRKKINPYDDCIKNILIYLTAEKHKFPI